MPRNGGVYSLPSGYLGVTGETILASQHNNPLEDIAAALTASLPRDGSAAMLGNLPMGGFKLTNLAAGTASGDAVIISQLKKAAPAGMVKAWPGVNAPTGWLFCFGQAVATATYPDLNTNLYVGDSLNATANFGYRTTSQADPSNNRSTSGQYIVLPDYRGRALFGKDNMGGASADRLTGLSGGIDGDTLHAAGGLETHTLTEAQIPEIQPILNDPGHNHDEQRRSGTSIVEGGSGTAPNFGNTTAKTSTDQTGITIDPFGGGEAHNNVPPGAVVNWIIFGGL